LEREILRTFIEVITRRVMSQIYIFDRHPGKVGPFLSIVQDIVERSL